MVWKDSTKSIVKNIRTTTESSHCGLSGTLTLLQIVWFWWPSESVEEEFLKNLILHNFFSKTSTKPTTMLHPSASGSCTLAALRVRCLSRCVLTLVRNCSRGPSLSALCAVLFHLLLRPFSLLLGYLIQPWKGSLRLVLLYLVMPCLADIPERPALVLRKPEEGLI